MRRTQFTSFGGPEVLFTGEVPEPAARAGRVRVRVLARAVNPVDIGTRSGALAGVMTGLELPAVPGWDFAGDLIDPSGDLPAGARVLGFIPGFAEPGRGSYADVVSVDPGWIAALEPSVDPAAGAVAALNGSTALLALRNLQVTAGQTVLITGASGAVGGAAVQLAAQRGATVLAISSPGDEAAVEQPGVTVSSKYNWDQRVDALLDTTGQAAELLAAVRDGGAVTTVVPPPIESERGIAVSLTWREPDSDDLAEIAAALTSGVLTPRVAETFPLEQAAQAHARFEQRGLRGKIVLI